jgi:hypothetical protein
VIVHSLVGHKELRFLISMTYALVPLLLLAADSLPPAMGARLAAWQRLRVARAAAGIFVALNLLALLVMTFKPSSETEVVYRWLYEESRKQPVVLYTASSSPYSMAGSMANFYRPENLTVRDLRTSAELRAAIADQPGRVFFFQRSLRSPGWMAADGITCAPVVRTVPAWAARFNFNNWLTRMYVWTVFAVSAGPAGSGGC